MSEVSDEERIELMRVEEAAKLLKTTSSTVYRLIRQGELDGVRFGRSVRIRRTALLAFIENHSGGA